MDALHILTLFTLAWAQPILDRHARNAWFLVANRVPIVDIVLLVLLLCLLLPGVLVLSEVLVGLLSSRLRNLLHAVLVYGLLLLLIYGLLTKVSEWSESSTFGVALGLSAAGVLIYLRFSMAQFFVTCLSLSLLVVPANFLWQTKTLQSLAATSSPLVAAASSATTPVVMVVFDELPLVSLLDGKGEIDPIRYPNFAALAGDAHWFRNATTISDRTHYSVPAMLTGKNPQIDRLPNLLDHSNNLFTLLGGAYQMHVDESITDLCPDQLCQQVGSSLAQRAAWMKLSLLDQELSRHYFHEKRFERFIGFVDSIDITSEPELYFVHSLLPHSPWMYSPSGTLHVSPQSGDTTLMDEHMGEHRSDGSWQISQAYQRHLLQVAFVDSLLGDLVQRLKATGLYDRALVVVVGDHGVSFSSGEDRRNLALATAPDIVPVPLLIKLPQQSEGIVSDRNVQTIDILPTIADVLDIEIPWHVDGHSALDASSPEPSEKRVMSRTGEWFTFGRTIEGVGDAVQRKLALFGDGSVPNGLFRIGHYPELIGQRVNDLTIDGVEPMTVALDEEADLAAVDPTSGFIPARITGRLNAVPDPAEPIYLAVAVNGTVRAMTQSVVESGEVRFVAMLPEAALVPGVNTVEVLRVDGPEGAPQISRLTRAQVSGHDGS